MRGISPWILVHLLGQSISIGERVFVSTGGPRRGSVAIESQAVVSARELLSEQFSCSAGQDGSLVEGSGMGQVS